MDMRVFFPATQVGTRYRCKDGSVLSSVPANLEVLEGVQVGSCSTGGAVRMAVQQ